MGAPDTRVVPATAEHARELAPTMRKEDAAEVLASSGRTPLEALLASLEASPYCRALLFDGRVAALFGVGPGPEGLGIVWLLTGELVEGHKQAFLDTCRPEIGKMLEVHPVLGNLVDARYVRSVRWLKRLGADIREAVPFGVAGLPFHPFLLTRETFHV